MYSSYLWSSFPISGKSGKSYHDSTTNYRSLPVRTQNRMQRAIIWNSQKSWQHSVNLDIFRYRTISTDPKYEFQNMIRFITDLAYAVWWFETMRVMVLYLCWVPWGERGFLLSVAKWVRLADGWGIPVRCPERSSLYSHWLAQWRVSWSELAALLFPRFHWRMARCLSLH